MGYEFDALVVVLLGGVSMVGGMDTVLGMFVGAIILSVVTSASRAYYFRRTGSSSLRRSDLRCQRCPTVRP